MSLKGNYILLEGWMSEKLNLKGNELITFALIYGFSQEPDHDFHGSAQYIADWTGTNKRTVFNILKSLVDKGYIKRTEEIINNVTFVHYKSAIKVVDEKISLPMNYNNTGDEKTALELCKNSMGVVKKFHGGSEKISSNNNIYNIEYNIDNKIDIKNNISKDIFKKVPNFHQIIKEFLTETFSIESDEKFEKVVYDFAVHRKEKKAPLTDNSLKLNLNKAYKLSNGTLSDCISLIETAIANGWQGIYKDNSYNSNHKEFKPRNINLDFDNEECKNQLKNEVIPF